MSKALSSLELKALKQGRQIAVLYKDAEAGTPRVLFASYPYPVAAHFFAAYSDDLTRQLDKLTVADLTVLTTKNQSAFTITGGNSIIHRDILAWALSCCDGGGVQRFNEPRDKRFSYLWFAKDCAERLGCTQVLAPIKARLELLQRTQIHSEDVRYLYHTLPADHPLLLLLAQHITDHLWEGTLRRKSCYDVVRQEFPALHVSINHLFEQKKAGRRAERLAATVAAHNHNHQAPRPRGPIDGKRVVIQQHNNNAKPAHAETAKVTEDNAKPAAAAEKIGEAPVVSETDAAAVVSSGAPTAAKKTVARKSTPRLVQKGEVVRRHEESMPNKPQSGMGRTFAAVAADNTVTVNPNAATAPAVHAELT